MACSKWGTLAILKCYARRKHDVLHNVLQQEGYRVLPIAPGRNSEAFAQFLRHLPPSVKHQIEAVAMDGSRAYRWAVESELPQAKICLDRFHLYRDTDQMMRAAWQEISQSKEGKMQRQVIRRIAKLTSQDDKQARDLLDKLSASHRINAELIAFSGSLRRLGSMAHFIGWQSIYQASLVLLCVLVLGQLNFRPMQDSRTPVTSPMPSHQNSPMPRLRVSTER